VDPSNVQDGASSTAAAMSTFICDDDGGVTVAEVACEAVREHQAAVMGDQLRALAGRNGGRLAIGLGRVTSLSAAFFCELRRARERCERLGGRLVLYGASARVRDAIRAVGVELDVAPSREEAVRRCAASARGGPVWLPAWFRKARAA
jgi:anti-anti-sigma regulatory factor